MADWYKPDPGLRPPSAGSDARAKAPEDPLVELARIVAGPSALDSGRRPPEPSPRQPSADEEMESEIGATPVHSDPIPPPAYDPIPAWPPVQPSAAPAPESAEADFDEFAHMHLRHSPRVSARRAEERAIVQDTPAAWDPVEMDRQILGGPGDDFVDTGARSPAAYSPPGSPSYLAASAYRPASASYEQADPLLIDSVAAAEPFSSEADGADADFSVGRFGEEGFEENQDYAEDDRQGVAPPRGGLNRNMLMAGAAAVVLVVVGLGGYLIFGRGSGASTAPAVIAADNGPVKVAAAPQPAQNTPRSVTDRPNDGANDRLRANEAPNTAPPQVADQGSQGSRDIARLADEGNDIRANAPPGTKIVRTVIVRPDGTIIANNTGSNAAPAAARPASAPNTNATPPTATTVRTTNVTPNQGTPAPAPTARPATGAPTSITPSGGTTTVTPTTPARTASNNAAAAAPAGGGYVVQVTSQKSESAAAAAFRDLQKRVPALAGKQADTKRVDLGDRGIFYRVRVGPASTREAAADFCSSLKGAGVDCVVVQN
jgi:cell division protein FtsN